MAILLFSLRNVPHDEADEVRTLLTTHNIAFYETPAGSWGVSMPAIWLYDAQFLNLAQQLLADYQQQRFINQRQHYILAKRTGSIPNFWCRLRQHPGLFIVYFSAIALVLYASMRLVYELGWQGDTFYHEALRNFSL